LKPQVGTYLPNNDSIVVEGLFANGRLKLSALFETLVEHLSPL